MRSENDAMELFGRFNFDQAEAIPKALIVLSEALLAIVKSNREIAEANKQIAEAIESLSKETSSTPGPLGIIAEAVKQVPRKGSGFRAQPKFAEKTPSKWSARWARSL